MNKPVGGRGKKAPYQTTHYRIPEPIKELVESLADQYRDYVSEGDTLAFDNKHLLPKVPAIYFVLEDEEIVYVGQTRSLRDRWRNHHVTARLNDLSGNISIAWLQCDEAKLLTALEKTLINSLSPKFNLPKGGYFPHAERWGRRSNWENSPTKTVRVPEDLVDKVLAFAHKIDNPVAEKAQLKVELEQLRDRYLATLPLGRQAPEYKRTKKILNNFIAFIESA